MLDALVAVTVLRAGDRYLWQRKTPGYPLPRYVGHLCPLGGGWTKADDASPRHTAWRELCEEMLPAGAVPPIDRLRFVGWFDVRLSPEATGTRDYHTWNFVFTADLPAAVPVERVQLAEGEAAVTGERPTDEAFCWGHDHVLWAWLGEHGPHAGRPPAGGITCRRVSEEEPRRYADLDLSALRVNPLRSGDVADDRPFQTPPSTG